jgi:hypothetical protein
MYPLFRSEGESKRTETPARTQTFRSAKPKHRDINTRSQRFHPSTSAVARHDVDPQAHCAKTVPDASRTEL